MRLAVEPVIQHRGLEPARISHARHLAVRGEGVGRIIAHQRCAQSLLDAGDATFGVVMLLGDPVGAVIARGAWGTGVTGISWVHPHSTAQLAVARVVIHLADAESGTACRHHRLRSQAARIVDCANLAYRLNEGQSGRRQRGGGARHSTRLNFEYLVVGITISGFRSGPETVFTLGTDLPDFPPENIVTSIGCIIAARQRAVG